MTGDELAAALYAEQGYMVLWSLKPLTIGSLTDSEGDSTAVLRILGEATKEEYLKQSRRAKELAPHIAGMPHGRDLLAHFYRVEAAD